MGQKFSNFSKVLGDHHITKLPQEEAIATWQSRDDRNYRIEMIHWLLDILLQKLCTKVPRKHLTDIARLLELALYRRAHSFDEYVNYDTLEKRLQYLALLGYPPHSRFHKKGNEIPLKPLIRKRKISESTSARKKRIRCGLSVNVFSPTKSNSATNFILGNKEDVIQHIYSYLEGAEILQNCFINRFALKILPKCVRKIHLSAHQLEDMLLSSFSQSSLIYLCTHLEHISISNHFENEMPMDYQKTMYNSKQYHQCYGCSPINSEQAIQELSLLIKKKTFPRLKALEIRSVFFNSTNINAIHGICDALSQNACPDIERLCLIGNGIGDDGASEIGAMLLSKSCKSLQHLDLRNNYIGERGGISIFNALGQSSCPSLKDLCFGGNIVSDHSGYILSQVLGSCSLSKLHFLGLDNTFMREKTIIHLAEGLRRGCPNLLHLSLENNQTGLYGSRALASCLLSKPNCSLQFLDAGNVCTKGIAKLIESANQLENPLTMEYSEYP